MKTIMLAAAFALALSSAAIAGQCQEDIEKIDAALASQDLSADSRAELEDMRNQAVQLCGAGNEAEGLDVTAEAKAMLNIQ
jgi:opacity protein-like surface antigen